MNVNRQAVVIIHGIGEQRPMDTLRGFVTALNRLSWHSSPRGIWNKPDTVSKGYEHRRLTLPGTRTRPTTDVYELYWAHLFEQTSMAPLTAWLSQLLLRPASGLPPRFRRVRWLLAIVAICLVAAVWGASQLLPIDSWIAWAAGIPVISAIYLGVLGLINSLLLGTVSDAARYLDANPLNVTARNAVRALGVEFLSDLHASERNYDRIIICGHSLGSVIGYDILQHYWYRVHDEHGHPERPDQSVEKAFSKALRKDETGRASGFQRNLFLEQVRLGNPWRVSDFVTMGSPLTHADLLMADSADAFEALMLSGELSRCPPDLGEGEKRIGYQRKYQITGGAYRTIFVPHHTAVFAVTRWSNLYFPRRLAVLGDPVGGPVAGLFGAGVRDICVDLPGRPCRFLHSAYWTGDIPDGTVDDDPCHPLVALRDVLELDSRKLDPVEKP